jgi:hypothetical protein
LGAKPQAIHDLLSQTTSLKSFELATGETNQGHDVDFEMALGVATGFNKNVSLKRVKLHVSNAVGHGYIARAVGGGHLLVMISGLDRHPTLEELVVWYQHPGLDLFVAISKVVHFTPLLTKLEVREDYDPDNNMTRYYNADVNLTRSC